MLLKKKHSCILFEKKLQMDGWMTKQNVWKRKKMNGAYSCFLSFILIECPTYLALLPFRCSILRFICFETRFLTRIELTLTAFQWSLQTIQHTTSERIQTMDRVIFYRWILFNAVFILTTVCLLFIPTVDIPFATLRLYLRSKNCEMTSKGIKT